MAMIYMPEHTPLGTSRADHLLYVITLPTHVSLFSYICMLCQLRTLRVTTADGVTTATGTEPNLKP